METELWDLATSHFSRRAYETASFFADKLITLSSKVEFEQIYLLGSCYFHNKEYPRVYHLLQKHNFLNYSLQTQVLAAQAMISSKNYQECIKILSEPTQTESDANWLALKYLYLGKAYEAKENKQLAGENYIQALKTDPNCVEAFNSLIDKQLLNSVKELELLYSLDLKDSWLKDFYLTRVKSFNPPSKKLHELSNNVDLMLSLGMQLLASHKIDQAYELACKILRDDPYLLAAVPLHCGCMAALGEIGELYNLSHNLVREYPDSAAAWYAAGTYYYVIKKCELARKFFIKAYKMEKDYLPAWIAYGHTYAAQDQSDQAMSAYRTVSRLFPGCYFASLYMGMEYLRTKNLRTALLSFELAKQVNGADPIVWNEIGVVLYKKQEFKKSNEVLLEALKLCDGVMHSTSETIMFNLAHTYRKLHQFDKSIEFYLKCIQLNSRCASTYSAIGLAYYLCNKVHEAVDAFNKALFLKSNDRFTNDLLYIALYECCENPPIELDMEIVA
jgi:anaphase-promoting complex subunit 6